MKERELEEKMFAMIEKLTANVMATRKFDGFSEEYIKEQTYGYIKENIEGLVCDAMTVGYDIGKGNIISITDLSMLPLPLPALVN